tara:strand:+ start:392 stop:679 length:288 start_codon:yes stop_codon:yes gene_type:complete
MALKNPKKADRNKNGKIEGWEKAIAKKIEKSMGMKRGGKKKTTKKKTKKKGPTPTNPSLYARVKAEAKKKFKVYPSAYANAWLVRTYKKRGGGYK